MIAREVEEVERQRSTNCNLLTAYVLTINSSLSINCTTTNQFDHDGDQDDLDVFVAKCVSLCPSLGLTCAAFSSLKYDLLTDRAIPADYRWGVEAATFFASTVISTIGYGSETPKTFGDDRF